MSQSGAAEEVWQQLTGQRLEREQILAPNIISLQADRSAGIDSDFFDAQVANSDREHRCQHAFDRATQAACAMLPATNRSMPPGIVVDLGCGRGALAEEVTNRGYCYIGVDASLENIRIAASRYPDQIFIHAMSHDIPFLGSSVAAFVFANFLHHVPDPTSLIKELTPFLQADGCIVGFEPNFLSPYGFLGWVKNFSVDRRIIQYNRWTLLRRFRRAGLHEVQVKGANLFPCFFEGPRLERFYDFVEDKFLNRLTRSLAVHQVVFGSKTPH